MRAGSIGRTSVGYGDNDDNTILTDMQNGYWSLMFRHTFTIAPGQIPSALRLKVRVDDGCVVWINGQYVATFHFATDNPNFNSAALDHEASPTVFEEVILSGVGAYLVEGTNVIAIHGANAALNSSDFTMDAELSGVVATNPTPGARNSLFTTNAPPAIRQVANTPEQPAASVPVTVTAKVTDPNGVASVSLQYQLVDPGAYIRLTDAAFATSWTSATMHDDGLDGDTVAGDGIYSVVLPANLQTHRRLVRYRIIATNGLAASVTVPYADDEQPNFAYFVYNGTPSWSGAVLPGGAGPRGVVQTFPGSLLNTHPDWHLLANGTDVDNSQYNSAFNGVRFFGTVVYEGKVYDHMTYHNRGIGSTYVSGKNKWALNFNRARDIRVRDNWGQLLQVRLELLPDRRLRLPVGGGASRHGGHRGGADVSTL